MGYSIFSLSLLVCFLKWGLLAGCSPTLAHVTEYDVVIPQKLGFRNKRSLEVKGKQIYPDELQYALTFKGNNYTLHLEKNRMLMGNGYTETHYLENGAEVTTTPYYWDHCYYQGRIEGIADSSVSLGTCSGIRGFVRAGQQVYLIEPLGDSVDGDHAVYRQEHLRGKRSTCGDHNVTFYDHGPRQSSLFKPSNKKSKPLMEQQRFVEMFLVVDNSEYNKNGGNMKSIQARMLEIANHVDKLYRPLNIRVMLVGLEVWTYKDKIDVSTSPDETLTKFLKWRQESLVKKRKHDNAQLITGVEFDGTTVGLATKFSMCTGSSGAVNEDHNKNPIGVASTVAHEMGHNLGMSHDNPQCSCATAAASGKNCIMSERVGHVYPERFSGCSQAELTTFLENANPWCLLDNPGSDKLFGGPVCGNAFVEAGEECDCGTVEECEDRCCNASTCRLAEGAQCALGECCHDCQIKAAGSLCRKSANDCDLAEFCTGATGECPRDAFRMNGLSCNSDGGYCYNGQCPTHRQQCRRLWGPGAQVGRDECFLQNTYGTQEAHCSKTRTGYQGCAQVDMKCGKLFCTGGNEYPTTGQKAILTLATGTRCNLAVDTSVTDDMGMVPTGTKCGDGKVCYDNICQDIKVYGTENCSAKCNNRGVCNNERQCHCDPGWAPPYCSVKLSHLPADPDGVVMGVSAAAAGLAALGLVIGALLCWRKKYPSKTKVQTGAGLSNPMFQEGGVRGSPRCGVPRISQPTFIESSVTQACTPLFVTVVPSRPAPQPPTAALQSASDPTQVVRPILPPVAPKNAVYLQDKPHPPKKPLPPLMVKQVNKPGPLPPVKPSGVQTPWRTPPVTVGRKTVPVPPPKPR